MLKKILEKNYGAGVWRSLALTRAALAILAGSSSWYVIVVVLLVVAAASTPC